MQLKAWQKNIVSAIIIAVGGFILFNIAFILAAATSQVCSLFVRLFAGNNDFAINPIFSRYVFALIVLCISWFVFKSKLKTLVILINIKRLSKGYHLTNRNKKAKQPKACDAKL